MIIKNLWPKQLKHLSIILNRAAVDELLIKSLRKRCSFSQRIIICIQIDPFLFFFSLLMMARHFTAGTPPAKIGNNNMGNAEFMTKVWPRVACVVVVQVLPILRSSSGRVSVDVVVGELQHSIWMDNGGNLYIVDDCRRDEIFGDRERRECSSRVPFIIIMFFSILLLLMDDIS